MKSDSDLALERVQSEALSALISIHSYQDVEPGYFGRLRAAVADAVSFFVSEDQVPDALFRELEGSAQTLRNEALAFPGRIDSCLEMADWLDEQRRALSNS